MRLLAGALCLVFALTATPEAGADPGAPGGAARPVRPAVAAGRLYEEAAVATRRYEAARRAVARQRAAVRSLEAAAAAERRRLAGLRDRIGRLARDQYRSGELTRAARLLMSASPEQLIARADALRDGEQAAYGALRAARRAGLRLAADTSAAARALAVLRTQAARQATAKREITRKLTRAQRALRNAAPTGSRGSGRHGRAGCPGGTADAWPASHWPADAPWVAPVEDYTLTAGYDDAGGHWAHRHTGQDFAVPVGTPVRAVGTGRVVLARCGDGFGNQVVLRHRDGYFTHYAHLDGIEVDEGDWVRTGERIALSGNTGNSTGPHLHFEVRVTPFMGSAVDPVEWLLERGVRL